MEQDGRTEIVVGELMPLPPLLPLHSGPRAMVFQKDLDRAEVGEERYQLAVALRDLAQRLGISLTRYAARVNRDRSSLSRFFSGHLVPPAEFVEQLIADGDRAAGAELPTGVRELVRGLHRRALLAANPKGARLQSLRDELADAERQAGLLQQETRLLRDMVITAKQQIDDRDARIRAVEASAAADRLIHRAELAQRSESFENLREERDRLRAMLEKLKRELVDSESRAAEAERRCVELENQLESAEAAAEVPAEEADEGLLLTDPVATGGAPVPYGGSDEGLREVVDALTAHPRRGERIVSAVMDAMDQVVNAAMTGRVRLGELSTIERASLAVIVENHLQHALNLPDVSPPGLVVAGHQVHLRVATRPLWIVSPGEWNDVFLLVEVNEAEGWWRIGLVRAIRENLVGRGSRDGKLPLGPVGRSAIHWLHPRVALPVDVLGALATDERQAITSAGSRQHQLDQLFRTVQRRPIDRRTVAAVARATEFARRARESALRLESEGIIVLDSYRARFGGTLAALGLPLPSRREYLAARLVRRRPDHGPVPSVELAGEQWCLARPEDPVESLPPGYQFR
ncbi:NaeI family type II restriction endonuclease [Kitasatospora sp. NPDC004531]